MKICPNCGSETEDDAVFCEECGYKIDEKRSSRPEKTDSSPKKKKVRFVRKK